MGSGTLDAAGGCYFSVCTFSQVVSIVALYTKCTRALTFENLCQDVVPITHEVPAGLKLNKKPLPGVCVCVCERERERERGSLARAVPLSYCVCE